MPSSSAHWGTGRTTSASAAVSERKKSDTTSRSSRSSPARTWMRSVRTPRRSTRGRAGPAVRRRAERLQQLYGRDAGAGDDGRVDAPDGRNVRTRRRVGDLAVAGQLIALLPVLPAALPVALPRQRAIARVLASGQPEGERQVDGRGRRIGAVDVLLDATAGEDVDPFSRGEATGDRAVRRRPARR